MMHIDKSYPSKIFILKNRANGKVDKLDKVISLPARLAAKPRAGKAGLNF
jgi:hypothetical protein